MAWTSISASQTDAGSIVNQTLMDAIRTNLDDLNTRVSAIAAFNNESIYEDFTADNLSLLGTVPAGTEEPYTWEIGGSTNPTLSPNPDHWLSCSSNGGYSAIAASAYRMRFDLSRDHTVIYEVRTKSIVSDNTDVWAFGFQDAALAIGAATIISDQSDFIGFVQGATANTYKAITSSGGATTTVATNQGNAANWTVLKVAVTFSGATQQVEFFIDGASVGTSTTNITAVRLRPVFGRQAGAGVRTQYADYILAYWVSRPLST